VITCAADADEAAAAAERARDAVRIVVDEPAGVLGGS
jgi:hypothetical protein